MRVGTITFHASFNYGSMLQAWALQRVLRNAGFETEIINFRSVNQKKQYSRPISFSSKHNIKQSLKWILRGPHAISLGNQKWNLFNKFLKKELNLSNEYCSLNQLTNNCDYDAIVVGSDQIWNIGVNDFSDAYFATFAPDFVRKIAYAPSLGPCPESLNLEYIKDKLKSFSAVSVREERSRDVLLKGNAFNEISLVLDPTLLLNGKEYESLFSCEPIIKDDYIFYYTPGGPRVEFLEQAEQLGDLLNKKVVCESFLDKKFLQKFPHVTTYAATGPSEFLNLIKNASFVCGASFHLMVFSILFKKKFFCFNGDVDSRMNNLMKTLGLEKQIVSLKLPVSEQINTDINYNSIYQKLEDLRKNSKEFLFDALKEKLA